MKKLFTYLSLATLCMASGAHAQYCPLTTGTPYSSAMPGIIQFNLNTIARSSLNVESTTGTVVSTGLSTNLIKGQTYTIQITHSEDAAFFPGARNNLRVWIDYNNNSSFADPGETVLSQDLVLPNTTFTSTFVVPTSVTNGSVRLRATAKMSADAGHSLPTPCDVPNDPLGYHGEMEDYTVNISGTAPTLTAHCTFPGRTPYSTNTPGITNVKLNTINRTSLASESATDIYVNTGLTTTLNISKVYTINISHSKDVFAYPNARNNIRVWIDLNNNFAFDDPGETMISANFVAAGVYTSTLVIPSTASVSTRRMRVMVKQSGDAGNTLPTTCDEPQDPQGFRGEVEDYYIAIAPANLAALGEQPYNTVHLQVFPNPASGQFNLSFDLAKAAEVSVELFDIAGKKLGTLLEKRTLPAAYHHYNFEKENRPAGVYYIKTNVENTSNWQKVIFVD